MVSGNWIPSIQKVIVWLYEDIVYRFHVDLC
jgi:hypothetical protein